jgi:predicted nucleic acid-binding protein
VNAYFDTGALVKLYLTEDGSEQAMTLFDAAEVAIVNALALVEVRAALAAAVRAGRLKAAELATAKADLRTLAETFVVVDPGGVLDAAADAAERGALRAYDAVHLATASAVAADDLLFVCWDADLSAAASRAGLATAGPAGAAAGGTVR